MTRASIRVLLVAPQAPPYGGMALQAKTLERLMRRDGICAALIPSNPEFPAGMRFLEGARGLRPFLRSVWFCVLLWRALRDADVVHILACSWLYFFVVVYPAVLLGRLRGKRVILNYRGGEAGKFFRKFGWLLRPAFHMASVVTSPSRFLAATIEERYRIPVVVVSNVVEFSRFRPRLREPLRPRLLSNRHLEKMYDVEAVLKAFRIIKAKRPDASLWIAGAGSEERRLRELVGAWGLNGVEFLGHVPHDELHQVYGQCDILLNGSRVDNFPAALLEASAAGLVIVSTDAGGIPFIYENGKTALLSPPGDYAQLAASVMVALQSPALAAELVRTSASIAQSCEWEQVRSSLYRVYGMAAAPTTAAAGDERAEVRP